LVAWPYHLHDLAWGKRRGRTTTGKGWPRRKGEESPEGALASRGRKGEEEGRPEWRTVRGRTEGDGSQKKDMSAKGARDLL